MKYLTQYLFAIVLATITAGAFATNGPMVNNTNPTDHPDQVTSTTSRNHDNHTTDKDSKNQNMNTNQNQNQNRNDSDRPQKSKTSQY